MRASRLVNLLLLLQTRGQLPANELARELEVSLRTVYRDVDALSEAGVPIYGERGPHGGIRLVDGYRTRLTGLTADEARALFLSGLPGPAAELGLANVVAAARLKLLAALPPELGAGAAQITQRFHLDAPRWFQQREEVPHLGMLAQAVWEDRPIELVYDRGESVVTRQVDPLGLVLKGGTWYLVGRCDGQDRTYRVSRVNTVSLRDGTFERPANFELAEFWTEAITAYERELPRVGVTLEIPEDELDIVYETIGRRATKEALRTATRQEGGSLRLHLTFEFLDEALGPLLRMASVARIIDPAGLREQVIEIADGILASQAESRLTASVRRRPRPDLDAAAVEPAGDDGTHPADERLGSGPQVSGVGGLPAVR
ncbi:MAG: WYL domain-containing protein [Chloroflexi bacterium]|nr:WYL domain-containing protein [Chloroflexota bacterium]